LQKTGVGIAYGIGWQPKPIVQMIDLKCDEYLRERIRTNLDAFSWQACCRNSLTAAAVAITVVDVQCNPNIHDITFLDSWNSHAAILLTRRAPHLRNHAGQWALPGGRIDTGESPEQTVLRELEEEVGLRLDRDRIMGRLDDYYTRSGFAITPIVLWGGTDVCLTANPAEVASIHRIPLAEFMRDDAPMLQTIQESEYPVLYMPVGNGHIAAPTAAMLYQFREVAILGNFVRVAHFEQPYFAWN
jgi:mutator protein MutT